MTREVMEYDVVIVGAGPAGLSAAIRLSQLANQQQCRLRICVLEKGSEVGAHLLSGAVLEPHALNELLPDWKNQAAPLDTEVQSDSFQFLTARYAIPLPTPPQMVNEGNYIISLGQFCRWLAKMAEGLGVELFPGFPAAEILWDAKGAVRGVATQALGLNKQGQQKPSYQAGVELQAKYTLFAEGCRGSLSKQLAERFQLYQSCSPQTYAIGIKELWEIDPSVHRAGEVRHTIGWPLDTKTYGGSFLYPMKPNLLSLGLVVGLDYTNPYLDPYAEFQRFKHHPSIQPLLAGGRRIEYGARALNEGGFQSIPKLSFPGGLLIGDAAGFLNVSKLKGNHTAMKSGMLAAEVVFQAFLQDKPIEARDTQYEQAIHASWLGKELKQARNIRPAFRWGLGPGLLYAALDTYVLRGCAPWTFQHRSDYLLLKKAQDCRPIIYPKPDGKISFDKLTSVQFSGVHHQEDQPCHLRLKDFNLAIRVNLAEYDAPEQRYCPANVYEIIRDATGENPKLQISAQNCIHCKTCDIKDPLQNIDWVTPEGGGGPNYSNM